ncbi:hypothetical protein MCUN1_003140 [Malassezia cuniculi]|uniref:Inositol polyphosphate-related phosphatase domain-containing protein n=1 Tax=Malassezia cuniculi TaxID=948313 RepID=A0AAF0F0W4_9BASI|nr:hypothetical protein MCUN1_003140 [Malassezia cuniculi]
MAYLGLFATENAEAAAWGLDSDEDETDEEAQAAVDVRHSLAASINGAHIPGVSQPLVSAPISGTHHAPYSDMSMYHDEPNAWKHASDISVGGDESFIPLAEFPPLGPEFSAEEREQMTRRYQRRQWRQEKQAAALGWVKGKKIKPRRIRIANPRFWAVFSFVFLICGSNPIVPVPDRSAMEITTSPMGFNMNGTLIVRADNSAAWIPSHIKSLTATIALTKSSVTVAKGVLSGSFQHGGFEGQWDAANTEATTTDHTIPSDGAQRPQIKIRILTWNMHNQIPKGDLESILGNIGEYIAPPAHWDTALDSDDDEYDGRFVVGQEHLPRSDRIPPLPIDDAHPFHIFVVACQECPWSNNSILRQGLHTASDISTGVRKARSAHIDPDADTSVADESGVSSIPTSPTFGSHSDVQRVRGWTDACDEWLCRGQRIRPMPLSPVENTAQPPWQQQTQQQQQSRSRPHTPPPEEYKGAPTRLGPYTLVIKERMMGCYMAVYVWRGCLDRVRGASSNIVKSGLLAGRMGNKGAVGVSIKLGRTRLLFVNSHLAAHASKVDARIANINKIRTELDVDTFLPKNDPRRRLQDVTQRFDYSFWFGDMNFRIDATRKHADWLLMNKLYHRALEFDQLRGLLKSHRVLDGFTEEPIRFPPTYKFDVIKWQTQTKGATSDDEQDALSRQSSLTSTGTSFTAGSLSYPGARKRYWSFFRGASKQPDPSLTTQMQGLSTGELAPDLRRRESQTSLSKMSDSSSFAEDVFTSLELSRQQSHQSVSSNSSTQSSSNAKMKATAAAIKQVYDTSAKQRVPSWCDRVLWRSTIPVRKDTDNRWRRNTEDLCREMNHNNQRQQTESSHDNTRSTRASQSLGPVMQSFVNHFRAPVDWIQTNRDKKLREHNEHQLELQLEANAQLPTKPVLYGPRRGEVFTMTYRSLEDREMQILEGRSDHRPVIYACAVGI